MNAVAVECTEYHVEEREIRDLFSVGVQIPCQNLKRLKCCNINAACRMNYKKY